MSYLSVWVVHLPQRLRKLTPYVFLSPHQLYDHRQVPTTLEASVFSPEK